MARSAKKPGRRTPRRQPGDVPDSTITAAGHGEEPSMESTTKTPREDRAG